MSIDTLRIERDTYQTALACLLAAADDYTRSYNQHGGSALITGRCWDTMRQAMDAAGQALDAEEDEA